MDVSALEASKLCMYSLVQFHKVQKFWRSSLDEVAHLFSLIWGWVVGRDRLGDRRCGGGWKVAEHGGQGIVFSGLARKRVFQIEISFFNALLLLFGQTLAYFERGVDLGCELLQLIQTTGVLPGLAQVRGAHQDSEGCFGPSALGQVPCPGDDLALVRRVIRYRCRSCHSC